MFNFYGKIVQKAIGHICTKKKLTFLVERRCRGILGAIWRMKIGTDAILTLEKNLMFIIFLK